MSDRSGDPNARLPATQSATVAVRESETVRSLQRERDELRHERDELVRERDKLMGEIAQNHATMTALDEAKRELDEFLSIASHELKTPLTGIRGYLQIALQRLRGLMTASADSDKDAERLARVQMVLERAEQQSGHMARLINDLLDASRVQASRLELRQAVRDLAVTLRDIVEEQRLASPGRVIELETAPAPVLVNMDALRIGQVLTNLLTNASKYAPGDAPIAVRLRVASDEARVEVIDHGPGLGPEEQQRVWDRFYRSPAVIARQGSEGLGLGLYISRAIIERHGGRVGVESTLGAGATFSFTLPLATLPLATLPLATLPLATLPRLPE